MRAEKLKAFLVQSFQAGRRVLIKGKPGIGKSDIVAQACDEIGAAMVLMHPAISDPTDYKGMPALCGDTTKLRGLRQQFESLSETHFLGRLEEWETWARVQHNGTFNPDDYIGADKLRRKFSFETEYSPVPSGSDFRLNISDEEREIMAQQVDVRVNDAVQSAQSDLWQRLATPLSAMVDRLKDPKAIFRDSLVSNLADISALIPKLNLAADNALFSFATQVEKQLAGLVPQTLRKDTSARDAARQQAEAILASMAGYMPKA